MKTILGPFHPDLESALVEELLEHKNTDLLCPLLVLTPSDLLRRRLKILLSRERGLSFVNVHFLTFYQLALKLQEESDRAPRALQSDLYLEEALRQTIRSRRPGTGPFAGIEERAGGCAALWQTLRDLRDGAVDAGVALEALTEGHFSRRADERTADLLALFRNFQELCRRHEIFDPSDLFLDATERVSQTSFLRHFTQVFYYGFYDLTQIQLDFFHAVSRAHPTTLFFPLLNVEPHHDAWSFAEDFYERYVQGRSDAATRTPARDRPLPAVARLFDGAARSYADLPEAWQCRITSAFGMHDEVALAAKEILRLVDDEGLAFHEVGVTARSLETYGPVIRNIFHEHCIPIAGTFDEPLSHSPLAKAVILLLNLPAQDFVRSQVIDLVSSPYFRFPKSAPANPRPDLWDLASRELAICKGVAEWRRLWRYQRRDLELRQISEDDEPRAVRIPREQLLALAEIVDGLAADLLKLPEQASWREYAALWTTLLEKYLAIAPDDAPSAGAEAAVSAAISAILGELADLDRVDDRIALGDFVHTFQHWLERAQVTEDCRNVDGVMVLNATASRGLSFRALFVLGMNEGVFPRTIREDAFLRDRDREVLERDLGFKVSQKLAAFDEEKLLFTLLAGAARERFHCSFQRADENGRALAPSWYIDELKRALADAGRPCATIAIPRSMAEKAGAAPFDRTELLLPKELATRLTFAGQNPTALIEQFAALPALYRHGRTVVAALDQSGDRLLPYDGALADFEGYWKHFSDRGLSPTALETYARCPFQFFARHVLGLAPLDRPEEILGPSPAEFGEIGHDILNAFYRALIDDGYFAGKATPLQVDAALQHAAARAFAEYEENHPIGYPLAWESVKESLLQLLRQVIAVDLAELARSGFVPASLETDVTGRLPDDWPEPLKNLAIRGRMDRIDRKDGALRVIDYKFKMGAAPATDDKNLPRAALRGAKLQPPFYVILARQWAEEHSADPARAAIEANFYHIAPRWPDGPLVPAGYDGDALADRNGVETRQTIAGLADGVRRGNFFIARGDYCGHCDAAPICRKNHPPSLWRAENDPATESHRALRKKAVTDDEHEPDID